MADDAHAPRPDAPEPEPSSSPEPTPASTPEGAAASAPPTPAPADAQTGGGIYDEFGTAKRNLPPLAPVAIAIVLVAAVVVGLVYLTRAKPAAHGTIDGVLFSQPADMPAMVLIKLTLHNGDKTLYIKDISAAVKTDQGEQSDSAAATSDYDRYLSVYPELQGQRRPLAVETKIPPGGQLQGTVLISLPITKQQFEARKDTTVTIQSYDYGAIVIHEKSAQK